MLGTGSRMCENLGGDLYHPNGLVRERALDQSEVGNDLAQPFPLRVVDMNMSYVINISK
jgi:hypothetical protein